ncbi:MAG TPA: IS110 family transposase, partial [Actinophytocola sp.]|uniref:IS110 family transposase n=1 Tax=Actinophytocola sp. TaxID=1872138 RepID=UPI002E0461EA|nr:IS110 family transposase [Actinophytocola sp.]
MEIIYSRVAAIDVGKREIAVAVRMPGDTPGQRRQRIRKYKTFYPVLRQMVAWLVEQGVTHVAMEATGVYWKPVFHALCEAERIEVLLVNARHAKNVPGRKTDVKDSEWLAQLLECGLLRGSFIPPKDIAAIRELTRYRKKLIETRTRELQRLSKVLEDGGIKIDSVASTITTLSARDMIEALIAGQRDPRVLAELARGVMRTKIPDLTMACAGRFGEHHALLARLHTDHIDHLTAMIEGLDVRIEEMMDPFAEPVRLLKTVPGIGDRAAQVIISEIGVDMSRFPTAAHLASWAGLCPGNNESAGKHKSGRTRKGNTEVRTILTECAWAAGRTGTYVDARFRRLHRRFGKKGGGRAALAIAHTLIVIIWHVLHDSAKYRDLGSDYFTRHDNPEARKR